MSVDKQLTKLRTQSSTVTARLTSFQSVGKPVLKFRSSERLVMGFPIVRIYGPSNKLVSNSEQQNVLVVSTFRNRGIFIPVHKPVSNLEQQSAR